MNILSIASIMGVILTILLYFIVPKKIQPLTLLIISLIFYTFNNFKNLIFLLVTSLSVYFAGLMIGKINEDFENKSKDLNRAEKKDLRNKRNSKKKLVLVIILILNFAILFYFKYFNSIIYIINNALDYERFSPLELIVPLGISFYTFQAIGYLIDVYRGKYKEEKSYPKLLLFLSYFPQMIQGPIGRYDDLSPQLFSHHKFNFERFVSGFQLVLWGYFKKLVIADGLVKIINPILDSPDVYKGFYIFGAIFLYSIQIYCDFSGGIDVVRGISEILGIELAVNFERPFFAKSLDEFWRRWHMTLGDWMRDYVFYPIAFSPKFAKFNKWLKKFDNKKLSKLLPSAVASLIVFLFVGIWHGPSFKYIAFGLYNGIIITISLFLQDKYPIWKEKLGINSETIDYKIFQILRTLFICIIGRYFTRANSFRHAMTLYKATLQSFNPYVWINGSIYEFGLSPEHITVIMLAIIFLFIIEFIQERGYEVREEITKMNVLSRVIITALLLSVILLFGHYGNFADTSNFIYQGF